MAFRKGDKDRLGPKMKRVAFRPLESTDDECRVDVKAPNGGSVFIGLGVNKFDMYA